MSARTAAYRLLIGSGTIKVVDVETCPSDNGDRVVSIAVVTWRQGRYKGTWATHVNPGVPITNTHVHKLTDADVATAPTFEDIRPAFENHLTAPDTYLVAHHAHFDVGVLHHEYALVGRALPDVPVLDTMLLPKGLAYETPGYGRSLPALCAHFTITNRNHHDAASDARATGEVLDKLLRVAADAGYADLAALTADAGTSVSHIPERTASAPTPEQETPLPPEHLRTHSALLGAKATQSALDRWAAAALECIELRCPLLADKARLADEHAIELHRRLTTILIEQGPTLEAGQGATLVGALSALARPGLDITTTKQGYTTWWKRHHQRLRQLARCTPDDACPTCRAGEPCPLDVAHQVVAEAVCCEGDGNITQDRRKRIAYTDKASYVIRWSAMGWHDLAGYAAWLVHEAWMRDRNPIRAGRAVDLAISQGCFDPRLVRLYAEALVLQGRSQDAEDLARTHLQRRNTDPGWGELAGWLQRHLALQLRQRKQKPADPKRTSPQVRRPAGRRRPNPYAVQRTEAR